MRFGKHFKKFLKEFKFSIIFTLVLTVTLMIALGTIFLRQSLLLQKSSADVSLDGQRLVINFKIDPTEQAGFSSFSQSLGVDDNWTKGITMTLNQKTADQLKNYLPQTIKIQATLKSLSFSNSQLNGLFSPQLNSAVPGQKIEWASESGRLSIHLVDGRWQINITDPAVLTQQATAAGQLKLAPGLLEQFWPVLSKFATIRADIGPDYLKGTIYLK